VRAVPGYAAPFERAYPGEGVSEKTIAKAIASYERTIVSGSSPFDAWVAGDENAAERTRETRLRFVQHQGQLRRVHSGWAFTDAGFHDVGLRSEDLGRGKLLPQLDSMRHAFKTPTLRNVEQRAPYMHDGSVASLATVRRALQSRRRGEAPQP